MDDIEQLKDDVAHTRIAVARLTNLVLALLQGDQIIMSTMDTLIDTATAAASRNTDLLESILKTFEGVKAGQDAAIADAVSKGATAAQVASMRALSSKIEQDGDKMAAAILANTPAAPPVPPPVP